MDLLSLITVFAANFGFIFLKAFQQQNVIRGKYLWVPPTSMVMAMGEVYIVAYVAVTGFSFPAVVAIGAGGSLGCLASMAVHRRLNKVKDNAK